MIQYINDGSKGMGAFVAVQDTVTAAEATANAIVVDLSEAFTAAPDFWIVQVFRSGVLVTEDAAISISGTNLTVADGALTYNVTAGDIVNVLACKSAG